MLFNSYGYMAFFPVVLILYYLLPSFMRLPMLLIASYGFYMCWNPKYIVLILISTIVTFTGGLVIEKQQNILHRKISIAIVFIINLSILFFFKYFNFALSNINSLLSFLRLQPIDSSLNVLLPVGISFYTFQALSYTVDVYRGTLPDVPGKKRLPGIKPEHSFITYALYVSFFPQLVAGPIERSERLISQIKSAGTRSRRELFSFSNIKNGFYLLIWGLFLKMMIADRLCDFVDEIFKNYSRYGTITLFLGAAAFSLQIYCDFYSYSTMAVGSAKMMGVTLMDNFDTPYFAASIKDFWHRWHISLSTWFRDYLYIPLGGSRQGRVSKYRNLLITFLVSGLWHGASWNFIVWGGLHGIYQIIEDICEPLVKKTNDILSTKTESFSYKMLCTLKTSLMACFAWIFFRAESIRTALAYIKRMLTHPDVWVIFDESIYNHSLDFEEMTILFISIQLFFIISYLKYRFKKNLDELLSSQCIWFQVLFIYLLLTAISVFGIYGISEEAESFIYFQF